MFDGIPDNIYVKKQPMLPDSTSCITVMLRIMMPIEKGIGMSNSNGSRKLAYATACHKHLIKPSDVCAHAPFQELQVVG